MIATIRTRFDPPWGTKGVTDTVSYQPQFSSSEEALDGDLGVGEPGKVHEHDRTEEFHAEGKGSVRAAREKAEEVLNGPVGTVSDTKVEVVDGGDGVEVSGSVRKSARSRRKA